VRELPGYRRRRLRGDAVAGVTVAALAIPSAMAYADLAGLSPVTGLYAVLLPAVAYMLLGSSRQVIVGPEGSLSVMVAVGLAPLALPQTDRYAGLAAMVAVLVAGLFLLARVLRLGWIADYFSRAVLVGYLHGVAVVLVAGQLGKLSGVGIEARNALPQVAELLREITTVDRLTLVVGAGSLAVLAACRRLPKVPGPLVVVVGGILASAAFRLESHGVAVVGHIPPGLPRPALPHAATGEILRLLPVAAGIFAVCFADGVLTARAFAGKRGQNITADQELLALGSANLAAGLSQAFPVGASSSRTAVNDQMGGRTQLVGVIAAAVVALVLVWLTAPVGYLPKTCLGAIIVMAAVGLVQPPAWGALAAAGAGQVLIAAVAMAGVVVVGVLEALVVAVILSIIELVARTARPHDAVLGWVERMGRYADVSLHPSARRTEGVVVYRLDDKLIFTNASYVQARIGEAIEGAATATRFLVFDAESVNGIDASGVEAVEQLHDRLHRHGIVLVVARLRGPVERQFRSTGLTALLGHGNFHPTVRAAVAACARSAAGPPDRLDRE
jgi:sulfate permease, SulP family